MKTLFEKLGFRRMDEMEHSIILRAQAYSFRFLAAALFLWSCWESWVVRPNGGSLNQKPCLLLLAACFIQIGIQQLLTRRAVAGDEEYKAPSLLRMALPVLFFALLILFVGVFVIIGGQ